MLLLAVSCGGNSNARLEKLVKTIDNECPKQINSEVDFGTVTGAKLDGDNVVITVSMNEEFFNIKTLQDNEDLLMMNLRNILSSPTADTEALLDELEKGNGGITYVYVGRQSGEQVSATLSADEIKRLRNANSNPDELLASQIEISNIHLPLQVDEMTVLKSIFREGDNVVYLYEIDEEQIAIQQIEAVRELFAEELLNEVKANVNSSKLFFNACRNAKVNLIYRYSGNASDESIDFPLLIDDIL